MDLQEIKRPIEQELEQFDRAFKNIQKSNIFLLDTITGYILKRKGKQIRPILVFLSAGLCGKIDSVSLRGAALIELLHTATLVHDDVVDDSQYRRGFFSVNALWKNKIAVLVGDFLLSRGLLLSLEHKDYDLLEIISFAVKEMSEGELLQVEKTKTLDITEEIYYNIIKKKTATLLIACCEIGAVSAKASPDMIAQIKLLGEKIGVIFQLKDDIFDYQTTNFIGKPTEIDIKEKKITLPLIYALRNAKHGEQQRILHIIKYKNQDSDKRKEVIQFVKEQKGIEYTQNAIDTYYQDASHILELFPNSEYKTSMEKLILYLVQRNI
ncbi:MAG: polyprenyl synthetase family protein [Chitinophagaceae bacterium]|nr:polyprenyl synthetase family protein [Chitinophagaceae bacterium]